MGCGKSKLDAVANGSILTRKKSSINGAPEAVKEETTIPANGIDLKQGEIVGGGKVIEGEKEKEFTVVEGEGSVSKESPEKNHDDEATTNGAPEAVKEETTVPANGIDLKQGEIVGGGKVIEGEKEKEFAVVEGEGSVLKESPEKNHDDEATTMTTTKTIVVDETEEKPSTMDESSGTTQA